MLNLDEFVDPSGVLLLDDFAKLFGERRPPSMISIYQIVKDLMGKKEYHGIQLVDGKDVDFGEFYIRCESITTKQKRIFLPYSINANVDILW
jgi:hypothetical protein